MDKDTEDQIEYFKKLAEAQGVALATTGDGAKVLLMSKKKLLEMAEMASGKGYVMILLQSDTDPSRTLN